MDSVLLGAVIGAAGAILGGFLGSLLLVTFDARRRRSEHRDAVKAVLDELNANLRNIASVQEGGGGSKVGLRDGAYLNLRLPLLSHLPAGIASDIADAYAWVPIVWQAPNPLMRGDFAGEAAPVLDKARRSLEAYARRRRRSEGWGELLSSNRT